MESDLASILCVAKLDRLVERCKNERLLDLLDLYESDKDGFWKHFKEKVGVTKIGERLALASALKKALASSQGALQWRQGFLAADTQPTPPAAKEKRSHRAALPNEAYLPTETCALLDDVDDDDEEEEEEPMAVEAHGGDGAVVVSQRDFDRAMRVTRCTHGVLSPDAHAEMVARFECFHISGGASLAPPA